MILETFENLIEIIETIFEMGAARIIGIHPFFETPASAKNLSGSILPGFYNQYQYPAGIFISTETEFHPVKRH
jgi:hypothetical protein